MATSHFMPRDRKEEATLEPGKGLNLGPKPNDRLQIQVE